MGRINALVSAVVDPVSGQPESKASPVSVISFAAKWYGFAICKSEISPGTAYWAKAKTESGWQYELADTQLPNDWRAFARELFGFDTDEVCVVEGPNPATFRTTFSKDGKVIAALYTSHAPIALSRPFLGASIGTETDVLAGRPGSDQPDAGAIICACFNVGLNTIMRSIHLDQLITVDQIGRALQAGTNCGSCRPELSALLKQSALKTAAE